MPETLELKVLYVCTYLVYVQILTTLVFTNSKLFKIGLTKKCSSCTIYKLKKTHAISFMTAPIRAPLRADFAVAGLIFRVKI